MDEPDFIQKRLRLVWRTHLYAVLGIHAAVFIPTFLLWNVTFLPLSLLIGVLSVFAAQCLTLLALALVCRPDTRPAAHAIGFSPSSVAQLPPPQNRVLGQSNLVLGSSSTVSQAANVFLSVLAQAAALPLGLLGELSLRNACARLAPVGLTWSQLATLAALGTCQAVELVWRQRHVLKQPVIQRSLFRGFKLALTPALYSAAGPALVVLCVLPGGPRTTIALWGMLHVACCQLALSTFQIVFTLRHEHQPSPQRLIECLLSPENLAPVELPADTQPFLGHLSRFCGYADALALCELAESPSEAAFLARQDLFLAVEQYVSTVRCCVSRLDVMTARIRARLGVPVPGGVVRLLAMSFPGRFVGPEVGVLSSSVVTEAWPPSSTFNDFKLCEWAARTVTALTLWSLRQDKAGTAQLSGSNGAVLSSLLSALLACRELAVAGDTQGAPSRSLSQLWPDWFFWVQAARGKGMQPTQGPRGFPSRLVQSTCSISEALRRGPVCAEAVAMADILEGCVIQIGDTFGGEVVPGWKHNGGRPSAAWFGTGTEPLFGTQAHHMQTLQALMARRLRQQ